MISPSRSDFSQHWKQAQDNDINEKYLTARPTPTKTALAEPRSNQTTSEERNNRRRRAVRYGRPLGMTMCQRIVAVRVAQPDPRIHPDQTQDPRQADNKAQTRPSPSRETTRSQAYINERVSYWACLATGRSSARIDWIDHYCPLPDTSRKTMREVLPS